MFVCLEVLKLIKIRRGECWVALIEGVIASAVQLANYGGKAGPDLSSCGAIMIRNLG